MGEVFVGFDETVERKLVVKELAARGKSAFTGKEE